ncbi:MAG: hypothetical protein K6D59_02230 [Bacteroidales bacterium]|nr:hypothetical protein [Bacteroidales bacterium]
MDEGTVGRVASDGVHIISYHNHDQYGEFIWSDPTTNNGLQFPMDNNLIVYDFERISDTVFFCGTNNGRGMVGYFTESLFTSGSGTVEHYIVPQLATLTKMEVYADPNSGNHIVAAVGEDPIDYVAQTIKTGIVISEFTGANINYNYYTVNDYVDDRYFQDIAVTKNKIITSGLMNHIYGLFLLTVIDKSTLNTFDYYIFPETAGDQNSHFYSIEYLKNDEVAVSTLVHHYTYPNNYFSPIHVFDATSGSIINSQTVPLVSKRSHYNEMKYFPMEDKLLLLQTNYYPDEYTVNSVIYYIEPYNTNPYPSFLICDPKSYYYSLDRYSDYDLLATGNLKTDEHSFMIHHIKDNPPFSCVEHEDIIISNITPPNTQPNNPIQLQQLQSLPLSFNVKPSILKNAILCDK